jgi:5'-3' exonuclease
VSDERTAAGAVSDDARMRIHLVDGTYELFRHHMGLPSEVAASSRGAATRGVMRSVLDLIAGGATHVGVATDTVIESFRNELWPGYKTGAGVEPALLDQFPLVERGLEAMGVTVWGMIDVEADDALATAAARAAEDEEVERVVICTPDKDLAQCVRGRRVVQLDRRQDRMRDEDGVRERFGVGPASIPDYLALVGDSADGFPGLPGWGAKSAAAVLSRYGTIDAVPSDSAHWDVAVRGAARLGAALAEGRELAGLFRTLATLREDVEGVLADGPGELAWSGPHDDLAAFCEEIDAPDVLERAHALAPEA